MTDSKSGSVPNKRRKLEERAGSFTSSTSVDNNDDELRRKAVANTIHVPHHQDPKLVHYLDGHDIIRHSHTPFKSGGFCDVFTGDHPIYGKLAMRRPRMTEEGYTSNEMKNFCIESKIWQKLRHPNILQFIGLIQSDGHIWAVSRFAENGVLPSYLKEHPLADRCALVCQLADAIAYLHRQGVVHGDLKGSNILISAAATVLVCDFGLSKLSGTSTNTSLSGAGSIRWCAPELLFDEKTKTCASDVCSFGMTVYEILSGNIPLHDIANDIHAMQEIHKGIRPPKEPPASESGDPYEPLWNIASESWDTNPFNRPTMEAVCVRLEVPTTFSGTTAEELSFAETMTLQPGGSALAHQAKDVVRGFDRLRAGRVINRDAHDARGQQYSVEGEIMISNPSMDSSYQDVSRTESRYPRSQASDEEILIRGMPRAHARYDDASTRPSRLSSRH